MVIGLAIMKKRIVQSSVGNVAEEFGEGRFCAFPP